MIPRTFKDALTGKMTAEEFAETEALMTGRGATHPSPPVSDDGLLPIEEIWRIGDLIRHAEVETASGPRSVGYYLSVGIDHFGHPHDRFQALLNAAAEAVLKDANTRAAPSVVVER